MENLRRLVEETEAQTDSHPAMNHAGTGIWTQEVRLKDSPS